MTETTLPILDLQPEIEQHWDALNEAFQRVLRSGRFIGGPEVQAFEAEAAAYLGATHAIGLNSGTDALVVALRALGIGPGDEVITTPFTFFATAEAISLIGATPVFVDVDERTFNLDPAFLEAAITERTRAILPVHLYGQPAAMAQILAIAERHGLRVIEDCAQSFGARYQGDCPDCRGAHCDEAYRRRLYGRMTGTMGDVGTYSFFPSKNLGAFGDAGLLATDDDALAETARKLRAHGGARKYHNEMLGYNSRLDALQAALLRVKLPHVDAANAARRAAAVRYTEALADVPGIVAPEVTDGHVIHQYTVRVLDGRRDALADALAEAGIQTMVYYPVPVHRLPVYAEAGFPAMPVAERLAGEVLSLPIGPGLTVEDQRRILTALLRAARA
ncbi:DegT/DnrJ/EryC1/StrS family aminotransferase [Rubrivirga sp. IMCC45206]|uniref:DegT/DnrJ/EryC1/StrS family aminotransferase n=1 Tax=Rubrivirga sp. IMCC45206 TaxID=3391614 RepID=UPI0039900399